MYLQWFAAGAFEHEILTQVGELLRHRLLEQCHQCFAIDEQIGQLLLCQHPKRAFEQILRGRIDEMNAAIGV
jgi:hypothetical protein